MRRYAPHHTHVATWSASTGSPRQRALKSLRSFFYAILNHLPSPLSTAPLRPRPLYLPDSLPNHDVHALPLLAALRRWLSLEAPVKPVERLALRLLISRNSNVGTVGKGGVCYLCAGEIDVGQVKDEGVGGVGVGGGTKAWGWGAGGDLLWNVVMVAMLWVVYVLFGVLRWMARLRSRVKGRAVVRDLRRGLERVMSGALCYSEWYGAARVLDVVGGVASVKEERGGGLHALCASCRQVWGDAALERARRRAASDMRRGVEGVCDLDMILGKLNELALLYRSGDVKGLAFALRASLERNLGGMCHPELQAHSLVGTHWVVEDYVNVISYLLAYVGQSAARGKGEVGVEEESLLTMDDKLTFLNEARHAYGRTALMLSGGAAMGLNHLGVVKALLQQGLMPKVVCGTSAGALVASMVGIFDDGELLDILTSESLMNPISGRPFSFRFFDDHTSVLRRLRRFLRKGYIQDVKMLQDCLRKNYGDLTFEEAYNKTRRILNITVCPLRSSSDPPLLLNYLTAPHVLIWSAASASCALPYVFAPVELVTKSANGRLVPYHPDGVRWIDGSISSDVPLARIGELFNVNHFIVSQTNPHVIPRSMPIMQTRMALLIKSELQFRYWQALQMGFVPKLLTSIFPHFMQPYAGDVTIMPDVRISDLFKLLSNPTVESLLGFIRRGEVQTFPFIDRIRLHCLIERTLDRSVECVAAAAKGDETAQSPSSPSRRPPVLFGRVPSWLWLDTRSILTSGAMSAVANRLAKRGNEDTGSESGDDGDERRPEREFGLNGKGGRRRGTELHVNSSGVVDEMLDEALMGLAGANLSDDDEMDVTGQGEDEVGEAERAGGIPVEGSTGL